MVTSEDIALAHLDAALELLKRALGVTDDLARMAGLVGAAIVQADRARERVAHDARQREYAEAVGYAPPLDDHPA